VEAGVPWFSQSDLNKAEILVCREDREAGTSALALPERSLLPRTPGSTALDILIQTSA
jgi:hypothetical protein